MVGLRNTFPSAKYLLPLCSLLLCLLVSSAAAQTQQTQPQKPSDDVLRTYTELVQTDVMVFDKQGKFITDLTKDNFELRIDGKPRPIQAFELITAGSDEESQLAAARGATTVNIKRPVPLDRGRIVFFYVDDFHMSAPDYPLARKAITNFIEKEMGQNDQVAISSATGQIGFLQQLTNDRTVLHAALERLTPRMYSVRDNDRPPMTEYQALLIERGDRDVLEFFISETIRMNPGLNRETAAAIVRGRSRAIEAQGAVFNSHTLTGLERLVRTAKNLPGRKIVFFLSGGFLIENRQGDAITKVRDVTTAAAKTGVVIYSIDARGLVTGLPDAASDIAFDPTGRLVSSQHGELTATQDGMHALAADTGGKLIINTNDLSKGFAPAMKETSAYYLLAWKPDAEAQKQKRFRSLEVKLLNRSDLTVRVRKGFYDVDPDPVVATTQPAATASPSPAAKTAAAKLRESITAPYPERSLPILLSADYYDVAGKGPTLATSVLIPGEFLVFGPQAEGKNQAIVDLSGIFYDDKGTAQGSFLERITVTESTKPQRDITFTYPIKLPPGLHQVRVAVRDDKSSRVGSAHAWIEIPDLAKKQLTMSSLLLGERFQATVTNVSKSEGDGPVALSASHRFGRDSTLRFLLFVYNTSLSPRDKLPDTAVQVQVVRDDQPVITTALRKISTDAVTDLMRLPYAAEIPLNSLPPGRYLLMVSVIDRLSKQSATRQTYFDVY